MIIVGAGIVGASFAYHAYQNGVHKITVLSSHLPGDKNQATSNTWGWVNGYASNDKSYATFRLANLNYWPKLKDQTKNRILMVIFGVFFISIFILLALLMF